MPAAAGFRTASVSFQLSCKTRAVQVPGVGLEPSFLEEPVMLLAIVLLGRTLEARARLRATGEQPSI